MIFSSWFLRLWGPSLTGWQGSNRDLHIKRLAKDLHVRLFMFDDIQHFTNQSPLWIGKLFDWIKYLLNDLEIAVVVAGIPRAAEALHSDEQISTRFESLTMPRWQVGEAFEQFLTNFERTFPLLEASDLGAPEMQEEILLASRGVTRLMIGQLMNAAIYAIDQGIERIDASLLEVRSRHPRELAIATKRALIAFRRMKLGDAAALEYFPELGQEGDGCPAAGELTALPATGS